MYERIDPAVLCLDEHGVPRSPLFGDVYHSRDGGLAQARHVFLAGNQLPERWQRRECFTILETGFGLGLNFLCAWQAWRDDPARCRRLHFVSFEKHPLRRDDLARAHRLWPELAGLSAALLARWPTLVPGLHRLHLDDGRVTLSLHLGDAADGLAQTECRADAIFLDGFAPACNPEMWTPRLCHLLAHSSSPGVTLATWSVSSAVRESLRRAGFSVAKAPGFGGKREMLSGRLTDALAARLPASPAQPQRRALVVGAGLAGTAVAQRLAARGWEIELIDQAAGPAQGASGNLAGVLRPLPSLDDNRLARLTRAGTLYGLNHLAALGEAGFEVRWEACGVLHLARDREHEERQREVVASQHPPEEFLRFVDADEAGRIAGYPPERGGWWFPAAGWVMPPSLCAANLAATGGLVRSSFGRNLAHLEPSAGGWLAVDRDGRPIAEAPQVILANGTGLAGIAQAAALPLRAARGQVTHLAALPGSAPRVVICRLGYLTPEIDGQRCAGATFQVDDPEPALRQADQDENLARLGYMLPGLRAELGEPALDGRVGFRPASPDRLPMIGALPEAIPRGSALRIEQVERRPGLYAIGGFGARGLVWSSLAGELLASQLEGECLPLSRDLVAAVDPARFLLKRPRRRFGNGE